MKKKMLTLFGVFGLAVMLAAPQAFALEKVLESVAKGCEKEPWYLPAPPLKASPLAFRSSAGRGAKTSSSPPPVPSRWTSEATGSRCFDS